MSVEIEELLLNVHPGEILQDLLDELEVSQTELAEHLGSTKKVVNEICRKKRGISPEMAFKLSRAFQNTTPGYWMNLQKNWELSQVDESSYREVEPIDIAA